MNGDKVKWIVGLAAFLCVALFAMGIFFRTGGAAKRGRRPMVSPVEIAGVEYRAPNTVETEGCVEAWDMNSQTLLWRKQVYHSLKIPLLEEDNQWIFIKSMVPSKSGDELVVVNESGRRYTVKTAPPGKYEFVLKIGALILWFAIVYVVFQFWRKRSARGAEAV